MKKIVYDKTICFYDERNQEVMYIDYSRDECIIGVNTDEKIIVDSDTELYSLLEKLMQQKYIFKNDVLINSKTDTTITWHSDCYYNPDDEFSVASVSCLNIAKKNNHIEIWCTKKSDEIFGKKTKSYVVAFSPCGNGQYSRNIETGLTFQDDFVIMIYYNLKNKSKVYKK